METTGTWRKRLDATHAAFAQADAHLARAARMVDADHPTEAVASLVNAVAALRDAVGTIEARLWGEENLPGE